MVSIVAFLFLQFYLFVIVYKLQFLHLRHLCYSQQLFVTQQLIRLMYTSRAYLLNVFSHYLH